MKYLLIIIALLLSACVKDGVSPTHYTEAARICTENGGVGTITRATTEDYYKSCGHKCWTPVGFMYSMNIECGNGTKVLRTWVDK